MLKRNIADVCREFADDTSFGIYPGIAAGLLSHIPLCERVVDKIEDASSRRDYGNGNYFYESGFSAGKSLGFLGLITIGYELAKIM